MHAFPGCVCFQAQGAGRQIYIRCPLRSAPIHVDSQELCIIHTFVHKYRADCKLFQHCNRVFLYAIAMQVSYHPCSITWHIQLAKLAICNFPTASSQFWPHLTLQQSHACACSESMCTLHSVYSPAFERIWENRVFNVLIPNRKLKRVEACKRISSVGSMADLVN